jgi:hypothetical protein
MVRISSRDIADGVRFFAIGYYGSQGESGSVGSGWPLITLRGLYVRWYVKSRSRLAREDIGRILGNEAEVNKVEENKILLIGISLLSCERL